MSAITPFQFPATGQQVRTVLVGDEPWFVAADVCAALGIGNTRQAVSYLDDDEVRLAPVTTDDGSGRTLPTNIVSEAGLYSLILRSRKPEAKAFKRWITHDVLPIIRRTGSYAVAEMSKADWIRQALEIEQEREQLAIENAKLRVKADQFDDWLNGKGCYLIGTVAKMLSIKPKAMWDFLYAEKILINRPGNKRHREPYSRPDTEGWFEIKAVAPDRANGHATRTTYLSPYGAEQVRLLLIKRGLLPCEQLALYAGGA